MVHVQSVHRAHQHLPCIMHPHFPSSYYACTDGKKQVGNRYRLIYHHDDVLELLPTILFTHARTHTRECVYV